MPRHSLFGLWWLIALLVGCEVFGRCVGCCLRLMGYPVGIGRRGFGGWGAGTVGGFLWSDSFFCAWGQKWLYFLFVGGLVLGPYGLRIPGCGW